jgi:hypothetical protein
MARDILTDLRRVTAVLRSRDKRVTVDRSYLEEAAAEIERLRQLVYDLGSDPSPR